MVKKFLLSIVLLLDAGNVFAADLDFGLGLAMVEEGDDRQRPAIIGHFGFAEHWFGRFLYFGRKFGPVTERTIVVSMNRTIDLFHQYGYDFLLANVGLCAMNEQTQIKFAGDSENSETENAGNLGFTFGVLAKIPSPSPMLFLFSWESHTFLAGEGGLLMANQRKQSIALIAGLRL